MRWRRRPAPGGRPRRSGNRPVVGWSSVSASVVEIGTAHGGTFCLWAGAAAPDAELISIDLPPWEIDDPLEARKQAGLREVARGRQRVHVIRGDSHAPQTVAAVELFLAGRPIDFLFIDGDHSYGGVKQDFDRFMPQVRTGGLIALHDIQPHSRGWGGDVPRFWLEIKGDYDSLEIIDDRRQNGFGIGVLRVHPQNCGAGGRPLDDVAPDRKCQAQSPFMPVAPMRGLGRPWRAARGRRSSRCACRHGADVTI